MPRVSRSPEADDDIIGIWLHIAADDPIAADEVLDYLDKQFELTARTPKMGRIREELWPEAYCFNVGRAAWRSQYPVFYRITDEGIEIARVLEGHRDINPDWFV